MMSAGVSQPSEKDVAEFVRLMLQHGWVTVAEVIAWADLRIAAAAQPPDWIVELAWNKDAWPDEIGCLLGKAPGVPSGDLPRQMLTCVLQDAWRLHQVSDIQFVEKWYELYPLHYEDLPSLRAKEVTSFLDQVWINLYCGETLPISYQEAALQLAERLEPYAQYQSMVDAVGLKRRGC